MFGVVEGVNDPLGRDVLSLLRTSWSTQRKINFLKRWRDRCTREIKLWENAYDQSVKAKKPQEHMKAGARLNRENVENLNKIIEIMKGN